MKKKFLMWFCISCTITIIYPVLAASDPLPSWHNGAVKQRILTFVHAVTNPKNVSFVAIENRIVVLDIDGTLWVEQPNYTQVAFIVDRLKTLFPQHPEWRSTFPHNVALSGNIKAIAKLPMNEFKCLLGATQQGLTVESYQQIVKEWLRVAKNPHYQRFYTQLSYQPMHELIAYLKQKKFQIYLVTGAGQEFARAFSKELFGINIDHVIGTTTQNHYTFNDKKPMLTLGSTILITNEKIGKPEAINLFIGRKPIMAIGNSLGDQQMFEWTESSKGKRLILIVHHDDAKREFAYDQNSPIGHLSKELLEEAKHFNWQVISMKSDWKMVFPFERK